VTSRVHRRLVTSLIALGSLVATVAVFAVWLDRQALDTGEWTNASGRLLQDAQVRGALAAYEVDVLYDNVDVAGQLGRMLPPDARPLAGPAALAVRPLLQQAAQRALGTPLALDAWRRANRLAHRRLLAILDGGGPVSTRNGTVSLDLRALVGQVAGATGASIPLPADSARLVVLHSDELQTAQRVVQGIRGLAALLTVLGVGLYATAFALAGGWRRVALHNIGIGAIAAGVLALLARALIGRYVVDALSANTTVRPAAGAVWSIGTSLLAQTAIFLAVDGLLLVGAAALAGPTPVARRLRSVTAPWLCDRPVATYSSAAIVYGLLVWWGPTLAFRQPISVAVIAVLMAAGTESLRRQVARELPDAAARGARLRMPRVGQRAAAGVARVRAALEHRGAATATATASHNGRVPVSAADVALIGQLADLRDRGALTDEEFALQKRHVLRT
jgi:hypothetical protein